MGVEAAIGGGLLGAITGSQGNSEEQISRTVLRPKSELEKQGEQLSSDQLTSLEELVGAGAGTEDVTTGLQSQRDLAGLLERLVASGGRPNEEQLARAQSFSQDIFAPERQAVTANFEEQNQRVNQLAAQLGRPVNDPILQAKLAQEQTRQLGAVDARQTAFRAEQAQNAPLQQLQLQQSLAGVRQGLASQAFANRQSLFALGQEALRGEQGFRAQTASKQTNSNQGGGLGGFLAGGFAGVGSGIKAAGELAALKKGNK